MTTSTPTLPDLDPLRARLDGSVHRPGDPGYDEARRPWNAAVDQRPALVVCAATPADVEAAVAFAARHDLRVAVQSTGHRASALPALDGALLLRLGALSGVTVDPGRRRARVLAGTPAADLVAAAAEHGLYPLVGSAKDVSVAGFALGGGLSFVGRRFGVAANHVTAIEVVTADGTLRTADAASEPELFWALRGTGGALGAVTALEVALQPVTTAYAGMLVWDAAHAPALVRAWAGWAPTAPDGITTSCKVMHVPPLPMFPEPLQGRSVVAVQGYDLDGGAAAEALLTELRAIAEPMLGGWGPTPAAGLQDIHGDPAGPVPSVGTGVPLAGLPDPAIDAVLAAATPGSGILSVDLRQLGGALATGVEGGGACDHVDAAFLAFAVAPLFDPATRPALTSVIDGLADALSPWRAAYGFSNYAERAGTAGDLFPPGVVRRLGEARKAYDPENRFVVSHPAL
jgi:hypothetical protein